MPKRSSSPDAARRNFLKGAGLIGAAAAVAPPVANALPAAPPTQLKAAVPGPRQIAAEIAPPGSDPVNQTTSGGDFMTDVLNSLGIEYLAINCASSYRGLHEAILNHGNNKPEIITCVHEDIAVHMGQGYAKIAGSADRDGLSRHGRPAARDNGDLQRLVRPRAGHRDRRQHHGG